MVLNQKDLKKVVTAAGIVGALNELDRLEGYLPNTSLTARKKALKSRLKDLVGDEKEEKEKLISLRIELPGEDKKEKSFNLKDLFSCKSKDDDDNDVVRVIRGCWPDDLGLGSIGKIIKEL